MTQNASKTRQLFERLANTEHRRSLTADRIFRQLRRDENEQSQQSRSVGA